MCTGFLKLESGPEDREIFICDSDHVLRLGVGAGLDVRDELAIGGDTLPLQPFIFLGEVPLGFGVARS